MIPVAFDYVRAGTAEEAIALLQEHGDEAKLIAGGHSLLPLMKLRLSTPSVLIDVGRLSELRYVRDAGDHIAIGKRFGADQQHEWSLRFQHFSNGRIKNPNPGENFLQFRYTQRF